VGGVGAPLPGPAPAAPTPPLAGLSLFDPCLPAPCPSPVPSHPPRYAANSSPLASQDGEAAHRGGAGAGGASGSGGGPGGGGGAIALSSLDGIFAGLEPHPPPQRGAGPAGGAARGGARL
jgi:hypothetical protein